MIQIYEKNEIRQFLKRFETRRQEVPQKVIDAVREILKRVKKEGDNALIELTRQFDGVECSKLGLSIRPQEMDEAATMVPAQFIDILKQSSVNIENYHKKTKRTSWIEWENNGVMVGQKISPLERVGIYVPGGRAIYPSSLIMAAVPARVAGVRDIVVVSPPQSNGNIHSAILVAADILGIKEIYRIGGAQAIGALAFGTQSIKPVDKIVGPGNIYVAEAKRQVYGNVAIDMIAGPSEVVILADETANPKFVASDLLAQAEHDPLASSICITWSKKLGLEIAKSLQEQVKRLSRREILKISLKKWSGILLTENLKKAIELVNRLAPEHLGIHLKNSWEQLTHIKNAGAIFIGHFSPETVGDYWAGPNHILPTNATARFASPLDTDDFVKKSSLIAFNKNALEKDGESIMTFAKMEGLDGHANAVRQRIG